jgi:hypothetical protein
VQLVGGYVVSTDPVQAAHAAPEDYAELFLLYGTDIRRVVQKQLGQVAQPQDIDDAVQYILGQFIKNQVIGQYKPDHVSEFTQQPVKFKAFILSKVAAYCKGVRETLGRRMREPLIADAPVGDGAASWLDQFGGGDWDDYPSLDDSEVFAWLRTYLASCRPEPGRPALLPLFDELAARVRNGEGAGPEAVRAIAGGTRAQAGAYLGELRAALREATSRTRYEVGGMQLTAAEVRSAVVALKTARGNHVMPAFAGHPLAKAGKTWYIAYGKEEIALFPEIVLPKGGHYEGGHTSQVKAGLIHRLERLLTGEVPLQLVAPSVPVPVVQPPPAPDLWPELEALLLRMPGSSTERVSMVMEAARLAFMEDLCTSPSR